jgi:predicted transcriptional regulator of viral defense system
MSMDRIELLDCIAEECSKDPQFRAIVLQKLKRTKRARAPLAATQQEILLRAFADRGRPMTFGELCHIPERRGVSRASTHQLLVRMEEKGTVCRLAHGLYAAVAPARAGDEG